MSRVHAHEDIIRDLRNQLEVAKLAADSWKNRADELDERCAELLTFIERIAGTYVPMEGLTEALESYRAEAQAIIDKSEGKP